MRNLPEARRPALTERECCSLDFLLTQAREGNGWEIRGVRGWRFAEEVACELQRQVEDDLRGLAEDRLLDRVSLDRYWRRRGHKLYRITAAGARALAERRGGKPATVMPPGPESDSARAALHLTVHAWLVLDSLVRRQLSGLGPGWKGEPGWMTGAEVHAAGGFVVTDVDIGWLERLGLVERGRALPPGYARAVPVYRATGTGRTLRVAETAPLPQAGVVYVQIEAEEPE